jgi:hypothetical protein
MSITLPARTAAPASATPSPARTNAAPMRSGPTTRTRIPNNRHPYLVWGTAWLVGYGAFALAGGDNPVVAHARPRRPADLSPTTSHTAGNGDRAAPGTVPRISVTTNLVASPR